MMIIDMSEDKRIVPTNIRAPLEKTSLPKVEVFFK